MTLHLIVNYSAASTIYDTACNSYQWNDSAYYASGEYIQYFETVNGCDSTVTLHLVVNYSDTTEDFATSCDNFTWNGVTYDSTGNYTQTLTNIHGCDSVVTLHLTINDTIFNDFNIEECNTTLGTALRTPPPAITCRPSSPPASATPSSRCI